VDFGLSEEQELLQATVRQFLERECPPTRLRQIFESESGEAPDLWKGMVELGLTGLAIPEAQGGAELGLLELALVCEELGYGAAPGPYLGHALASLAITRGGSPAQRERWLPQLASGTAIGTVAIGEGGGLWDPTEWTLPAGDTLHGAKAYVPGAEEADLFVVGLAGGNLAVVEGVSSGVEVCPVEAVDRTRRVAQVTFDGASAELLEEGAAAAPKLRDAALVLLAADAFGGASRCLEMAVEYAKTREQFGVTIGHFQSLKHQLADMALEIEPARALWWYAAHAHDAMPDRAERAAAVAKAHLTDAFMQVARDTVEAHGGIGFTWECDVQIWFKRAMFDRAFFGSPAVHRERAAQLAGWSARASTEDS
jgi:alkylation response protein AidB-like acyl-CoA dehydrogenase